MEIQFKDLGTREVIAGIKEKLGGRKLGDLLEIEADGEDIRVTIRKLGTSTLEFSHQKTKDGHSWELSKEKIALTHKAFKGEILAKLTNIVDSMGGKIIS
jgi:hypothetical protein